MFSNININGKDYLETKLGYFTEKNLNKIEVPKVDSISNVFIKNFKILYITTNDDGDVGNTNDDKNDCLYYTLLKLITFDNIPENINTKSKLKKFCNTSRNDKIDLIKNVNNLEKILQMNININGDVTRENNKYNKTINMVIKDNHIKPKKYKVFHLIENHNKEKKLLTISFDDDLNCVCYDGNEFYILTIEQRNKRFNNKNFIYNKVDTCDKIKMQQEHNDYITKRDYFYLYDNYLDFNKSQYINKLIYDKWRLLTSGFLDEPSPLTVLEQVACSQSNRGGLHYNSKIKNNLLKNNNVYY